MPLWMNILPRARTLSLAAATRRSRQRVQRRRRSLPRRRQRAARTLQRPRHPRTQVGLHKTTTAVRSHTSLRRSATTRLRRLSRRPLPQPRTGNMPWRYMRACVLTRFNGTQPGDLSVAAGEQIELLESISADWWRGQSLDGARQGIVPANYVSVQ